MPVSPQILAYVQEHKSELGLHAVNKMRIVAQIIRMYPDDSKKPSFTLLGRVFAAGDTLSLRALAQGIAGQAALESRRHLRKIWRCISHAAPGSMLMNDVVSQQDQKRLEAFCSRKNRMVLQFALAIQEVLAPDWPK